MAELVDLAPTRFAALVAPAIDRLFIAAMAAGRTGGGAEVTQRYGGAAATGCLVEFRTRLARPGGIVTAAQFAGVTRYRDPVALRAMLHRQAAHGMIVLGPDGEVSATDRGRAFLDEIYRVQAEITGRLWLTDHAQRAERLGAVLGRVLTAARHSGGDALAAMAPPYEPADAPVGVLLLNRLGTLRYHRADAHAAAWQAAGLTAADVVALPPGPAREAIEAVTNRLAGPPFAVLSAGERLTVLADLAALPA